MIITLSSRASINSESERLNLWPTKIYLSLYKLKFPLLIECKRSGGLCDLRSVFGRIAPLRKFLSAETSGMICLPKRYFQQNGN